MARYVVTIPASMHVIIEVEAEDEKAAIEAALGKRFNIEATNDVDIENVELHEQVGRGNICEFSKPWKATAECVDDD